MNPLPVNPAALLGGGLLAFLLGVGGGWTVNGWKLGKEAAERDAKIANDRAADAQAAVADIKAAAKLVKDAADGANVDLGRLGTKLDALSKEFKNAKPPALPADCRLDPIRLRYLQSAAEAVNESALGLKPSATLQSATGS